MADLHDNQLEFSVKNAAAADPLIGKVLFQKYEVIELLGKGGMGCVYQVRHLQLNKLCALKVMKSTAGVYKHALARFWARGTGGE